LFSNDIGKYTNGNFWYIVLFGNGVLIAVGNTSFFFQSKDFIIGLGMVGCVLAAVIGSFLLLVAFFPLLLRAYWIVVVVLLVVLIVLVVSVVAILLLVAMGVVGIYSFCIVRVTAFGI
jgi:hypothetical protein